jgi:hypothetical protein
MDDLAAHQLAGSGEASEAKGAEPAYRPVYGSDLDPIEPVFAELKAPLRCGGARSVDHLRRAIGRCRDGFGPTACAPNRASSDNGACLPGTVYVVVAAGWPSSWRLDGCAPVGFDHRRRCGPAAGRVDGTPKSNAVGLVVAHVVHATRRTAGGGVRQRGAVHTRRCERRSKARSKPP